jgi:hypothetical protein
MAKGYIYKKLHKLIDSLNPDLRVSKSREFFVMSPEDAYELLEAIAVISGSADKLKHVKNVKKQSEMRVKKPPINFTKCGIPIGAQLVYVDDPSVKVIVCDQRKVEYNNEITSLTAVARQFKKYKNVPGPSFFTYNGKLVTDIARETQWKD